MNIKDKEFNYYKKIEKTTYVLLFATLIGLGFVAHTHSFNLDLRIATSGFSILEVLQAHENPIGFARDYPGGSRVTTANSPTVHLYFLGHQLGLNWMAMIYVMIFLEMCTLLAGAWLFWNALFFNPEDNDLKFRQTINLGFAWVAFFILISSVQRANLSNFNFPFFYGQFYGFADGLRLAVLAMVLRHRWIAAAVLFSLCFAIHPIKAIIGAGMAAPLALFDWRSMLNYRFVAAVSLSGAACIAWYIITFSSATDSVPIGDFIAYTRTLQYHWYPFDHGLFGKQHLRGISPFMALVLVVLVVLAFDSWGKLLRRKLQFGLISLLVLTGLGLYFSVDERSATLIRIAFVRASNLITLLAPLFIVAGAVLAWRERKWAMTAGLLAFLWTAFTPSLGATSLPPMFALGLVALHFFHSKRVDYFLLAAALSVAGGIFWLAVSFTKGAGPFDATLPALIAAAAFWILFRLVDYKKDVKGAFLIAPVIVSAVFIYGGWQYSSQKSEAVSRNSVVSRAYLETQQWAHENTPETSLFMVDPCRWYGWRDFSGRASMGTVREWYMTAWVYSDRRELLDQGKEIARTLGFDMEPFRNAPRSNRAICQAARSAYYDPALAGPKQIAERYDVNFFVFEKEFAGSLPSELEQQAVFRNEHFFVLAAEELK